MVTISDIAAALGVTPSTVSRALSGSPRVKEETRLAVEKMAAEMGYERNIVASNLRKGRSDIVGIIVPRGGPTSSASSSRASTATSSPTSSAGPSPSWKRPATAS